MSSKIHPRSLFSRLFFYFLVVMLIPVILITVYYSALARRDVTMNVMDDSAVFIDNCVEDLSAILDTYGHKAFLLASSEAVADGIRNPNDSDIKGICYKEMFSIMSGDTNRATASVISLNGKARFSTHVFPSQYDLRYNTHARSPFSDLSTLEGSSSLMTLKWRYQGPDDKAAVLNIMRKIISRSKNDLGYAVVDVFLDAFAKVREGHQFSELVLIDRDNFYATSLLASDRYGSLSNFEGIDMGRIGEPYLAENGLVVVLRLIPGTRFSLAGVVDLSPYLSGLSRSLYMLLFVLLLGIVLASLAALFFSRGLSKPVKQLSTTMAQARGGQLNVRSCGSKITEINELDKSFDLMIRQIASLMELNREEEEKIRQAERKALEAQMNPHFLYNTLNAIKSIAKLHGEQEILTISVQLGKLLRSSIDNTENIVPLSSSIDLVRSYLTIQQIRFSDRLHVSMDIDEDVLDVKTPKLIIQPLVENAIVHGLEPKIGTWEIAISVKRKGSNVLITVTDNGVGFDPVNMKDFDSLKDSAHNGIYNIHRRLDIYYHGIAELAIDSTLNEGTTTSLLLPID